MLLFFNYLWSVAIISQCHVYDTREREGGGGNETKQINKGIINGPVPIF